MHINDEYIYVSRYFSRIVNLFNLISGHMMIQCCITNEQREFVGLTIATREKKSKNIYI